MLTLEIITSKFGRVVPDSPSLVVPLGFKITGAISGTPTYQKSLDGINWTNFNGSTNYTWNTDGFITEYVLPPHIYSFYVREVGNESNTGQVLNYNVELDVNSQGLHSLGSTPKILSSSIEVGNNKQLTIETEQPNQVVKIYATQTVLGQEVFSYPYIPIIEGVSNSEKLFIASIPTVRQNQKFVASAQGEFELESYCVNGVTAGLGVIGTSKQLSIAVAIGSLTGTGRNVSISVSGGSGNYSISKGIGENWSYTDNQSFELPFGRKYVIVKDNTTGLIFSKAVHIIPSGQQTITDIGLRSDFNSVTNPNGNWSYGYIENGNYTAFDSFAVRGSKQGWGKGSFQLPMVGYGDNTNVLDVNSIVLAPHSIEQGSTIGYGESKAVVRYTFANAGVFSATSFRLKKPTAGLVLDVKYYLQYQIKLNNSILYQGVLTARGEEVSIPLTNLNVQTGDILSIEVDSASNLEDSSPTFDELHVNFSGQLVSSSYVSPAAPNTPTLANGTGGSTTEINQGQTVLIKTAPSSNWIVVSKNNIPVSVIKTNLVSTEYVYTFIGGLTGSYSIKSVSNGVFNSGSAVQFNVKTSGAVAPSAPTISSAATISKGQTISIGVPIISDLLVYKNSTYVATIKVNAVNSVINYTALDTGSYTFKVLNNGLLSTASTSVTVGAGNTDCSAFSDNFVLGTFTSNNYQLSVFSLNGKNLILQTFADGKILRNANFINNPLVVSNYKGYESCFGYPKSDIYAALSVSDVGTVPGYKWAVTTDGLNVPYLIADSSVFKTYRVCANTPCENEVIQFAISSTVTNPSNLPSNAFSDPDGTIKVNSQNIEDVNGNNYYYKNFTVPSGVYTVFYKAKTSTSTPILAVSQQFI